MDHFTKSKSGAHENQQNRTAQPQRDIEIPAIHHVGRTLESDPNYLDLIGSGSPTPEAQIAEEAARTEPEVRALMQEGVDPITGRQHGPTRPEPLKTRLPGDTSSDPHTDIGPDNATSVQHRGEENRAPVHSTKHRRKRRAA